MRPLTGELLNAPSEQVCSLPSTEQQEQHQSSPLTISPSNPVLPSDEGLVQASNVRMDGLTEMELEELLMNGEQHPVWSEERVFNTNARSGRPFKLPSFPIKAIWCKTVICLMDMECELPPMLDAGVSPLHGRPRYLTEQEDYIFNHAPSASLARWRVYSPLRNYVGPEVEEMVDFGCAIDGCNQFFETRDMVVDHVFNVHKIFPPGVFKCSWEECDREDHFGAFYQVETHMQRHKVDRPYPCTMDGCTKSYRRLENLRTHLRTHSGEKPYKCKFDYCDRCFTNASDRAKHETRTHSEVKSFGCCLDECVKLYTDPSSLRKHIINSHGAEFYEEYKREKALERKRKIEQRMIERHILRSIHVSTGGPIRVQTSRRNPASATTASRGRRSQNNASLSPRSTLSSGSTVASTPFSQISPLPVENTVAVVAETPMNLTMPAILHDIPRPSPPPTTPMYQFPLRPTPIVPNPTFHIPQLAPLHPMLPLPMGPLPIPTFMPPMSPGFMSPQMINAMIMARLQMLSLNQQF